VWSENDFQKLKARLEFVLPFAHYFYSGVLGSGLCVFSKHKIISTLFHSWSVNGYFHRIQHGDWFGGKGVGKYKYKSFNKIKKFVLPEMFSSGLCRIRVQNQMVNFYTAHLHAEYDRTCDDYMAHRVIQAYDTAQFIAQTRSDCALQILAGDLNTEPTDLASKMFLNIAELKDSAMNRPEIVEGTNEIADNSYSCPTAAKQAPKGKRIDYIFYRGCGNFSSHCEQYTLPFPKRVPTQAFSFSDHEGVYARLSASLSAGPEQCENRKEITADSILSLQESIQICQASLAQLNSHRNSYYLLAIGMLFLLWNIIEVQPPYGLHIAHLVLKFAFCGIALFFMFMGTIWNAMEKNAVLAGRLAMEISLNDLLTDTMEY
jgi:sphingomyelin phosphodiesterase 2